MASGTYRVVRLIGRGGMGAVYEAEHVSTGELVAIKFVDRGLAYDERVTARFEREARAASAVASPHIVRVIDFGSDDGQPYIVMELLRGEDLGTRLARLRTVPIAEALHVVAQVLRGLAQAHAAGIVHRDLKPDNVLLVPHEGDPLFAKLVDFGISKIARLEGRASLAITQKGIVLGTPLFMSPEQAEAAPDIDARSDLYSVGAILFECLAGRPPHVGETEDQILSRIRTADAPDLRTVATDIPEPVARLVSTALQRDRAARFQTAAEMLASLEEIAEAVPYVPAPPPPALEPARSSAPSAPRRSRSRVPVVVAAVLATVSGVVVTVLVAGALRRPPSSVPAVASAPAPAVVASSGSRSVAPSASPAASPSTSAASGRAEPAAP